MRHIFLTQLGGFLLLVFAAVAHADTIEDGRFWLNVNATGAMPLDKWRWYAELQPRWREEGREFDQVLVRPAVYYQLSKQSSVWMGYAYVHTDPRNRDPFDEHRFWQQYLHTFQPFDWLTLQSRTRLEQRFLEHSDDTGHKIRQLVRLTVPSGLRPELHWLLWDEYFVNLNDTDYGARRGYDQNRAFIGVHWVFNAGTKLDVGYLNQHVNGKVNDIENHVLSTTLSLSF